MKHWTAINHQICFWLRPLTCWTGHSLGEALFYNFRPVEIKMEEVPVAGELGELRARYVVVGITVIPRTRPTWGAQRWASR